MLHVVVASFSSWSMSLFHLFHLDLCYMFFIFNTTCLCYISCILMLHLFLTYLCYISWLLALQTIHPKNTHCKFGKLFIHSHFLQSLSHLFRVNILRIWSNTNVRLHSLVLDYPLRRIASNKDHCQAKTLARALVSQCYTRRLPHRGTQLQVISQCPSSSIQLHLHHRGTQCKWIHNAHHQFWLPPTW